MIPTLPISEANAQAVAEQFNRQIAAARQQQQTTDQLARQLRQQIQSVINAWPLSDQQQFMLWFNQALRILTTARSNEIADKKHFGYYFAILSGILFFGFLIVAVYAAFTEANIFNGH